jgi:threonine synthase
MSIWRHANRIAAVPPAARITLGEGDTPLVRSRSIGPRAGLPELFFKLETGNPTGSYKDRFAVVAIAHMLARGLSTCIATSSGNTGAALAAACAAAGIRCRIALVETAPVGKTRQMQAYGAELFRVRGFGTDPRVTLDCFTAIRRLAARPGHALQVSAYTTSPDGMTGCETIAWELAEDLPTGIDHVFCPAGGGGLCLAIARGFAGAARAGGPAPAIECVQPAGNDTIAGPLRSGQPRAREVVCTSQISGLQVPSVLDGDLVIEACRTSGGTGHLVTDEEVWLVQRRLALEEGIFAEPAGAVALAGALAAVRAGGLRPGARVVCLVTGSGFKDEIALDRMIAGRDCPTIDRDDLRRMTAE